jgi:hypothetical protein
MKREYWIIAAVAMVVLAACGCAAVGAFVLWPDSTGPGTTPGNGASSKYQLVTTSAPEPPPEAPRLRLDHDTPKQLVDLLSGKWECIAFGKYEPEGTRLEFAASTNGRQGIGIWTKPEGERLDFSYEAYPQSSLFLRIRTTQGETGLGFSAHFPDENTLMLNTAETGEGHHYASMWKRVLP